MLFFAGLYVIISWQSDYFINLLKERVELLVELDRGLDKQVVNEFITQLDNMQEIVDGSPHFISGEEALAEMENEFGEDFFLEGMENPFNDAISFRLNAEFYQDDYMRELKQTLEKETFVKNVSYRQDIFGPIQGNLGRLSKIISILGILLIFGALVLIHNTLRLSLNAQRKVIKTMEMVGAKTGFVLKPFIWQGFLQGFLAGVLASLMIFGSLYALGEWLPVFKALYTTSRTLMVMGGLVVFGVLIYIIVTYFTVKRYLRLQMEDIF